MSFETTAAGEIPAFAIKTNGVQIPDSYQVLSLEVCHDIGRIPYARIALSDGDPAVETFAISESDTFAPGAEITIALGYDGKVTEVFSGIVVRQRIEAQTDSAAALHVEARHACFRMANARTSRVWINRTDADALSDLAAAHGVPFKGKSDTEHPQMVQHQASDWDFAVLRAERAGQILVAGLDGLSMLPPDPSQSPAVLLTYGDSILGFDLDLDAGLQAESVETAAWAPPHQALQSAKATADIVSGPGNLSGKKLAQTSKLTPRPRHPGARGQGELTDWASAEMIRRRLAAITGWVEAQGDSRATAGGTVDIRGVGARFEGVAFVSGVRHVLGEGRWRTTYRIGLDPAFHNERAPNNPDPVSAAPAAGLIPSISGLQIGVVDKLQGDPQGEGRVAIRISTHDKTQQSVWARPLSIGGGAGHGLVMLPEAGSECLLGFLDGDPRDPVLIGGLHSSAAASPMPPAEGNPEKGIVTRKGLRIAFDDRDVALSLETPAGTRITLSDRDHTLLLEDRNGNSVKLDAEGVTMTDAHRNSTTLGKRGVTIASQSNITLTAPGSIEITGGNLTMKAEIQASLRGGASATLDSGGQTAVKGAMVVID